MSKHLEDLFNLPPTEKEDFQLPIPESYDDISEETKSTLEKIEAAMPQVRGMEASDDEMDEIAAMAVESYKELLDLGMQVEARFSSEILSVASGFLGHALTAKTNKINKKLKQLDLQMKQVQLEQKLAQKKEDVEAIPVGTGQALDRNELLKMLLEKKS